MNKSLEKVQVALAAYNAEEENLFNVTATDTNDISMLTIIREDIEEFAVLVTASDTQLLFNVSLFDSAQVIDGQLASLNEMMLTLNIAMPLSSFALTGDIYSIFGAMSVNSEPAQIQEEVLVLSENIMDALEVCQQFLIKA